MSGIKVLLAEDHVITRQGIRQLLEQEHDFTVVGEAGDGEQAVRMATEMQPDVIVMDIAMPKLNGVEATRHIKLVRPTIAVLALSAYDDDEYVFGLLEAGAAGYLLKTVSVDELVHAIKAVYRGEPVLDPIVIRKMIDRLRLHDKVLSRERPYEHFSGREIHIIKLAAKGKSNKEIAEELALSTRTVEGHMRSIFNKLGVGSRTEAVLYGLKKGWFALEDLP